MTSSAQRGRVTPARVRIRAPLVLSCSRGDRTCTNPAVACCAQTLYSRAGNSIGKLRIVNVSPADGAVAVGPAPGLVTFAPITSNAAPMSGAPPERAVVLHPCNRDLH